MKQYEKSEKARLECLTSALRIGLVGDNEEEILAHEIGWRAAIVYMSMNGLLKDDKNDQLYDQAY